MNKQKDIYIVTNIKMLLKVFENGEYEPLTEYMNIDFGKIIEVPTLTTTLEDEIVQYNATLKGLFEQETQVQETPETPETPETTEIQETSETPETPETPDNIECIQYSSDTPYTSDTPSSENIDITLQTSILQGINRDLPFFILKKHLKKRKKIENKTFKNKITKSQNYTSKNYDN